MQKQDARVTNELEAAARRNRPLKKIDPEPKGPSTIEAVANVLSTPGASVLNALSGKNPITPWLHPTSSEGRVTGRDFLRQHDLISKQDTYGNFATGLAVEMLTDPTSYLGFGVLTKAGSVAKKAGLMKQGLPALDTLAKRTQTTARHLLDHADDSTAAKSAWHAAGGSDDLLDHPLESLVSAKVPGLPAVQFNNDAVAHGINKLGQKAMDLPGIRSLRAAFSPSVLNATTKQAQDIATQRHAATQQATTQLGERFAPMTKSPDPEAIQRITADVEHAAASAGLDMSRFTPITTQSDDIVSSALSHAEHLTRATGMAHAANELLANYARTDGLGVPLEQALSRLGMNTDAARRNLSERNPSIDLAKATIDEDLLADASRFVRPFTDPEVTGQARTLIESFNRIFKTHVTLPFPAFHSRNFVSGQLQNFLFNARDPNKKGLLAFLSPIREAYQLRQNTSLNGIASQIPEFKGMTDAQATDTLRNEIFARSLIGGGQSSADVASMVPAASTRMPGMSADINPLHGKFSPAPQGTTWRDALNPMNIDGKPKFLPVRVGADVSQFVEDLNRLAPYIAYRKQGYSPDAAAALVKRIQIDYNDTTNWEKKYGRNIIPFYLFSARMLPLVANELATNPGGPMAQMVKATGKAQRDNPQPKWMEGQTTIPTDEGQIGGLGLMHDDTVNLLGAVVSGDAKELKQSIGSKLNPLYKFPIEKLTGQSLYHGRPLSTLVPPVGEILAHMKELAGGPHEAPKPFLGQTLEHALSSSPASRYISTLKSAIDPKKDVLSKAAKITTGLYVAKQTRKSNDPKK